MSDVDQPIESGLTRRDLLKRGALLGGALAWGAPVVQIIGMRPAMAQEPSPSCPNLFCLTAQFGRRGLGPFQNCSLGTAAGQGRGNCLTPEDPEFVEADPIPGIVVESTMCPSHDDPEIDVPGILITLPSGCRLAGEDNFSGSPGTFLGNVSAAAKCGLRGGTLEKACDPPTLVEMNGNGQTTLCFPIECSNGTSISHVELVICCAEPPLADPD